MKKLQYLGLGLLATLLMAADCSNKDNEFYNDIYVTSPNLIAVEAQDDFAVGETIWVNADNFSNLIVEQGKADLLDLRRTTGGANSFTFSYLIERNVGGSDWQLYNPGDANLRTLAGTSVNFDDFILAQALFSTASQTYDYRGGVVLNEAGNFRLRFTYNSLPSKNIVLTSDAVSPNLFVTIYSPSDDLDASGYYYFNVN